MSRGNSASKRDQSDSHEDRKRNEDRDREEFYRIRQECYNTEDKISDREREIDMVREEIHLLKHRIAEKKHTLEDHNRDSESCKITIKQLYTRLTELSDKRKKDSDKGENIKKQISVVEEEVNGLDDTIKDNHRVIDQLKDDIWKQRQSIVDLDNKCSKLDSRTIEDKLYYANDRKSTYESEITRLDRKSISLKEIFNRLVKQRQDHESQHDSKDEEKKTKSIEDKIKQTEAHIRDDLDEMDKLNDERRELIRNTDYTQSKIRDAHTHLQTLKHNTQVLEQDNDCLKEDLNKLAQRDQEITRELDKTSHIRKLQEDFEREIQASPLK